LNWKVPLADLNYDERETQAVLQVLQSRWLTMGAVTQDFEREFARLTGARHALAVSNATVALHLACLALGIGPGDEVIVPSLTFVASANAVLYTGAEVRFADILGPHELNLSPESIERQITPRSKAILVVHYGGYPCRMPEIVDLARRHGLALIEDAAHAPGARLQGRHLGTWGDVGCFSFFSNKNLATGEGGMLVTNRDDVAEKVRLLRSHGMTSLTWDRHQGHAYSYDVVDLGYNYRIDELRSALGLVQLDKLAAGNARRAALTQQYWHAFCTPEDSAPTGLELPFYGRSGGDGNGSTAVQPAYHIFPLLLPPGADRQAFIDRLRQAGVQTSVHYPPVHTFQYYRRRYPGVSLPRTEAAATRQVTLPLYPGMSDDQLNHVVTAVKQALT
jgi:dTDP-4-amino-4,6-dideoxygalactose transaminase